MSVQSKTKRKSHLEADVVMRLFLHETLAIRNLTTRIQEVDRQLAQEFGRFNRISESIEKENNQILDLLLEPIVRVKRLEKDRFGLASKGGRRLWNLTGFREWWSEWACRMAAHRPPSRVS